MFTFAKNLDTNMKESGVMINSPKAWLLASRPKTLAGAAVPVMIGLSLAYADVGAQSFCVLPAVFCVLFAFIMQIDANFINDYFDFVRGNDDETRLGPKRACAMGWVTGYAMRWAIAVTTFLACAVGLPLILFGGMEMILVGLICVVFCFLYTTHFSYMGLGDVLVLVFFGLVPVSITYYLQAHTVTLEVVAASLACGLVIDTLLVVNNYRDIENDRRAGKKTIIVRLGHRAGGRVYLLTGVMACVAGLSFIYSGHVFAALLPVVYMLLHIATYRRMIIISHGSELNAILGDTARNIFIYGLLVSAGILLS